MTDQQELTYSASSAALLSLRILNRRGKCSARIVAGKPGGKRIMNGPLKGRHIIGYSAQDAAACLKATVTRIANIAVTPVILRIGSEGRFHMTKERFEQEKNYVLAVSIAKDLLKQELITDSEFRKIIKVFMEKYRPIIASLVA
jgi:hypothetical protein